MPCQWLYDPIIEITAIGYVIETSGDVLKMLIIPPIISVCYYISQLSSGLQFWGDFYSAGSVTYVTGFIKINPNHTGTEIHFIGKHYSLTLVLARNSLHMAIDGQICFHRSRWPFVIPIRSTRCTTGSLGPVNDINKDMSGTRLLPTTVLTYPVN